jgi:shikimate dehydrogenase
VLQRFAVIGNPVAHSLSPLIHQYFAQQVGCSLVYERMHVEELDFEQQVSSFFAAGGKGLNVTLPFKQKAFALAVTITPRCQSARAANTLWMQGDSLCADNTDGVGLVRDLARYISLQGARILVVGAGGAARGIVSPLLEAGPARLALANRNVTRLQTFQSDFPQLDYFSLAELSGAYDLVINATSSSVNAEPLVLPKAVFESLPFCYDLSYQLEKPTEFVAYAQCLGCRAVDGLGMLIEQAAESFYLWHGQRPDAARLLAQFIPQGLGLGDCGR